MKPADKASGGGPDPRKPKPRSCPICGDRAIAGYQPFCSQRCAYIDLGRWLDGRYVVEGPPLETQESDETGA